MTISAVETPMTLDSNQKSIIGAQTQHCLAQARAWFPQQRIADVMVKFDLRGQSAGHYYPAQNLIRFNSHIAARNFDHFVKQTVVHEVAHHIVYQLTRRVGIKPRAHGAEWQAIMQRFGLSPDRCHDYDLSNIPSKQQQRYPYQCACRQHWLSATRHNRVKKGFRYHCKLCQNLLRAQTS